jgi:KUP system potassium uptake protein
MAAGGIAHIKDTPEIWRALNPIHGYYFLISYGTASFIALGSVVLAITGAEALYADLGHFGKKPIRYAWLFFVLPCLILNYLGQGALALSNPEAVENAFFLLYPEWALLPIVILATLATVIASQAVITGAYSLTHQAIQLGFLPRLEVRYTSHKTLGQIYMPQVNTILMIGVLLLIEIFKDSSDLASAYGIAVTGTMVTTAILAFVVVHYKWKWPLIISVLVIAPLFLIDFAFLSSNMVKLFEGGFLPVMLSAVVLLLMRTWVRGSKFIGEQMYHHNTTIEKLIEGIATNSCHVMEGTAIFLTSSTEYAPSALLQNMKHNKIIHEQNILLTIKFESKPYIDDEKRIELHKVDDKFIRVAVAFGYMEIPDIMRTIPLMQALGLSFDVKKSSFFISRRNIVPSKEFGMPVWRDRIYINMANNASDAADYFNLPLDRVVELGVQVTV